MKEQSWLEEGWFFHNHAWHLLHEIIKQIPDNTESMLDFGAGTGIAAAIIKAIYPHIKITVSDIEESSILFWEKRNLHGYIEKSIELPCKDNKYDFVMSSHVLEHVYDYESVKFVSELIRVSKNRTVIVVPDGDVHFYDHKVIYNRTVLKETIKEAIGENNYKLTMFPLYHYHINNLIAVIDK